MILDGIYMAEIGTYCVLEGGGGYHPVKNEGGAGKFEPHHFWSVWSLLKSKLQKKSILAQKSYGSVFCDIPYRTIKEILKVERASLHWLASK